MRTPNSTWFDIVVATLGVSIFSTVFFLGIEKLLGWW